MSDQSLPPPNGFSRLLLEDPLEPGPEDQSAKPAPRVVQADFSAIEMRLMAQLSANERMAAEVARGQAIAREFLFAIDRNDLTVCFVRRSYWDAHHTMNSEHLAEELEDALHCARAGNNMEIEYEEMTEAMFVTSMDSWDILHEDLLLRGFQEDPAFQAYLDDH